MTSQRLLVWQDHPEFAGHEIMFCKMLPAVLKTFSAVEIHYPAINQAFAAALAPFASQQVRVVASPFTRVSAELYRAPFRRDYARYVKSAAERFQPTACLVLQGRIENTAVPLLTLKRLGTPVVSYIPMAHSCREIGSKGAGTGLPDLLRRAYYSIPDRFIVPSRAVAAQVRRAGGHDPHVVENVVPLERELPPSDGARTTLDLPLDRKVAMVIGRLKTRHKGLDRLLDMIARQRETLADWCFVLLGKGEGEKDLQARVRTKGLEGTVIFRPWLADPALAYAAADVLVMPARYEGVPLVMLEAMTVKAPILASEIDVFLEYLPETSRFSFEGDDDLSTALSTALSAEGLANYAVACQRNLQRMNLERSGLAFAGALASA